MELDLPDNTLPLDAVTLSERVLQDTKITHSLTDITEIVIKFETQNLIVYVYKLFQFIQASVTIRMMDLLCFVVLFVRKP